MPEGAIYVGRPSRWGNPWAVPEYTQQEAVRRYRRWLRGTLDIGIEAARYGVDGEQVRAYLVNQRLIILESLPLLRGHDLACWCALDQPCHASVLLELANATPASPEEPERERGDGDAARRELG